MSTFNKVFLLAMVLIVYFALILPWMLSQASDAIVIAGFLSLAGVAYFAISQFIKLINT